MCGHEAVDHDGGAGVCLIGRCPCTSLGLRVKIQAGEFILKAPRRLGSRHLLRLTRVDRQPRLTDPPRPSEGNQ
jgi:hypothetical protein